MSWLRVDDKLARHPKILKLPRADRWTWVELLCYCAEYRTDGYIPPTIGDVLRYVTPAFLKKAVAAGLLDEHDNGPIVHDWGDYNGRDPKILQAERKRQQRDRAVTNAGTQTGQTAGHGRVENVTRAQAPAPVPIPNPKEQDSLSQEGRNPQSERERSENEEDRRQAWLERSSRPDIRSPQAFVAAGIRSGGWPDPYVAAANGSARATENGSGSGPAYIAGLIRNGVIADLEDLETELTLAGVEDDDRSSLVAQLQLAQQLEGRR